MTSYGFNKEIEESIKKVVDGDKNGLFDALKYAKMREAWLAGKVREAPSK